jgi:hypothetical protein
MPAAPDDPLRAAFDARDLEMLREALAPEVVLHSPIFSVAFEGADELVDLYDVLFKVFGELSYTVESSGNPQIFAWKTEVGGELVEGADIVRYDDAGKIAEITVMMRPLRGIAAFLDKAGPMMAAKQSRGRATLMRAMGPPPSAVMRMLAALGPRMVGMRNAKR